MNSKKKIFYISQSIVLVFILLISLSFNYFLYDTFGFFLENMILVTLFSLCFALFLYFILSKSILDPLFKSDDNLQKALNETLHELNIPVSTIELNVKMLEKNIHDEKNIKRLNRIKMASKNLLKLYEDMEYSIKKEIDKIENKEFSLKECINESLLKFDDIKKDINIKINIEEVVLNADYNGFCTLLDNLLSNAIKYNNAEKRIEINYKNDILSIFNTGVSIDAQNLKNVFDMYYQEDRSLDGFGLGLNIVKEFCDNNKIFISIKPEEKGTIVYLNLKNLRKT
ncbi:MAG: HAMP domain-containing histidine kinase [Campylobacteraceae bacterium]|nr:HAMP domain-containing histidine kinase [Campylobacteraceae bacterium]